MFERKNTDCVCAHFISFITPLQRVVHGLYALNVKLTKLILQIGLPFLPSILKEEIRHTPEGWFNG